MPHRGAVYIAFGEDYYRQCVTSVELLMHHTDIGVTVVTNIPSSDNKANAFHINIDDTLENNRQYRTMANQFAFNENGPYDEWVNLDTDVAVVSPDFMTGFDMLQGHDAATLLQAECGGPATLGALGKHWLDFAAFRDFKFPLRVVTPGTCFFRSSPAIDELFRNWYDAWKHWSGPRDLPPFHWAVQNSPISVRILSDITSYHWTRNGKAIAIHYHDLMYGQSEVPLLPEIPKWRPDGFDG